ncbi:hypothetical protein Pelo_2667 [Pelomyxa schiedti]|nr:hypothetical protein Pelo_2667 [Pelomyxa schiedti]
MWRHQGPPAGCPPKPDDPNGSGSEENDDDYDDGGDYEGQDDPNGSGSDYDDRGQGDPGDDGEDDGSGGERRDDDDQEEEEEDEDEEEDLRALREYNEHRDRGGGGGGGGGGDADADAEEEGGGVGGWGGGGVEGSMFAGKGKSSGSGSSSRTTTTTPQKQQQQQGKQAAPMVLFAPPKLGDVVGNLFERKASPSVGVVGGSATATAGPGSGGGGSGSGSIFGGLGSPASGSGKSTFGSAPAVSSSSSPSSSGSGGGGGGGNSGSVFGGRSVFGGSGDASRTSGSSSSGAGDFGAATNFFSTGQPAAAAKTAVNPFAGMFQNAPPAALGFAPPSSASSSSTSSITTSSSGSRSVFGADTTGSSPAKPSSGTAPVLSLFEKKTEVAKPQEPAPILFAPIPSTSTKSDSPQTKKDTPSPVFKVPQPPITPPSFQFTPTPVPSNSTTTSSSTSPAFPGVVSGGPALGIFNGSGSLFSQNKPATPVLEIFEKKIPDAKQQGTSPPLFTTPKPIEERPSLFLVPIQSNPTQLTQHVIGVSASSDSTRSLTPATSSPTAPSPTLFSSIPSFSFSDTANSDPLSSLPSSDSPSSIFDSKKTKAPPSTTADEESSRPPQTQHRLPLKAQAKLANQKLNSASPPVTGHSSFTPTEPQVTATPFTFPAPTKDALDSLPAITTDPFSTSSKKHDSVHSEKPPATSPKFELPPVSSIFQPQGPPLPAPKVPDTLPLPAVPLSFSSGSSGSFDFKLPSVDSLESLPEATNPFATKQKKDQQSTSKSSTPDTIPVFSGTQSSFPLFTPKSISTTQIEEKQKLSLPPLPPPTPSENSTTVTAPVTPSKNPLSSPTPSILSTPTTARSSGLTNQTNESFEAIKARFQQPPALNSKSPGLPRTATPPVTTAPTASPSIENRTPIPTTPIKIETNKITPVAMPSPQIVIPPAAKPPGTTSQLSQDITPPITPTPTPTLEGPSPLLPYTTPVAVEPSKGTEPPHTQPWVPKAFPGRKTRLEPDLVDKIQKLFRYKREVSAYNVKEHQSTIASEYRHLSAKFSSLEESIKEIDLSCKIQKTHEIKAQKDLQRFNSLLYSTSRNATVLASICEYSTEYMEFLSNRLESNHIPTKTDLFELSLQVIDTAFDSKLRLDSLLKTLAHTGMTKPEPIPSIPANLPQISQQYTAYWSRTHNT